MKGALVGLELPRIDDDLLQVYECQNAGVERYNAANIALSERQVWNVMVSHLTGELRAASACEMPGKLVTACAEARVDVDENLLRLAESSSSAGPGFAPFPAGWAGTYHAWGS